MSEIKIQKVNDGEKQTLPVFEEIEKRLNAVKQRAFELFQNRGNGSGDELTDWLRAEHEILGWPAAELSENDHAYKVQVALPGFDANEVEVTTTPHEIVVHAATREEKKGTDDGVVWSEFGSNDVYRRFGLPCRIQTEKVEAKLEKGILRITAPQAEQSAKAAA